MLALVCSVAAEAAPLEAVLADHRPVVVGRRPATRGELAGVPVLLLPGGMGKTNAAQAVTALLETLRVDGVIGFGVGGAYPGSGLEPGQVALATREVYGDEGVALGDDWLSTREIGIPLLRLERESIFNAFELDATLVARAAAALTNAGVAPREGPFVTVSACSGTLTRGTQLAERFGGVCESMEGAAYAHVCALYDVPFVEVRGISNHVEDRDLSRWKLAAGIGAAGAAVEALLAGSVFPAPLRPRGSGTSREPAEER